MTARVAAGDRLHADAVPFPFRDVIGRIEAAEIRLLDRMRQHHRPERRRVAIDRLVAAAFEPGEQVGVGRGEAGPDQLDVVRVFAAERGGRGLGEARGDADPHRAGDEFEQGPAAGLVEFVEPARQLPRQLGFAEGAQGGDDFGQRGRRWVVVAGSDSLRLCTFFLTSPLAGEVGSRRLLPGEG
jgi:hypothetical protein